MGACFCCVSLCKGSDQSEGNIMMNPLPLDGPRPTNFEDAYSFVLDERTRQPKEIGRGHYAVVYLGKHKKTGRKVAVKDIDTRKTADDTRLKTEVDIMQKVGPNENIVHLYDVFRLPGKLRLVMEFMAGGELFEKLAEKPYSTHDAAKVTANLASALMFLHERNIVHRDLKPENLLLVSKNHPTAVKLADFGLAKILKGEVMFTVCGTWAYCAPEVKTNHTDAGYTKAVDVWSLGVITYIVLSGYHPFDPDGVTLDRELERRIKLAQYDFIDDAWNHVEPVAIDFVKKCLKAVPTERMTIQECLLHEWLRATGPGKAAAEAVKNRSLNAAKAPKSTGPRADKIQKFNESRKARKAAELNDSSDGGTSISEAAA